MLPRIVVFLALCLLISVIKTDNDQSVDEVLKFIEEAVSQHNILRKEHGVPELKLSPELVELAQEEADSFATQNKVESKQIRYKDQSVGKNIATMRGSSPFTGQAATKLWYQSGKNFNYKLNSMQNASGFTQVIWKDSKEIGVGMARKGTSTYVVAIYYPVGNVVGRITQNVFPLVSSEATQTDSTDKNSELINTLKKLLESLGTASTKEEAASSSFSKKLSEKLKSLKQ